MAEGREKHPSTTHDEDAFPPNPPRRQTILPWFLKYIRPKPYPQREYVKKHELPKSPLVIEAIGAADVITSRFVSSKGIKSFSMYADNVHILDETAWNHLTSLDPSFDEHSHPRLRYLQLFIRQSDARHPVEMCQTILHEMFHLKAYNSIQLNRYAPDEFIFHRIGLKTFTGRKKAEANLNSVSFTGLDEAITSKLEMKYLPKMLESASHMRNLLPRNRNALTSLKRKIAAQENLPSEEISWVSSDGKEYGVFPYRTQRLVLDYIIQCIYEDNKRKFKSEEEVFDEFAKAYATGNLLSIAKLVDNSFGEVAFRTLGTMSSDLEAARPMVDLWPQIRRKFKNTP